MKYSKIIRTLLIVGVLGASALSARAQSTVVGDAVHATAVAGYDIMFALTVTSPEDVAGLNGEITYDTTYLSNPAVSLGAGAAGFTALGNEMTPGVFRFVLYADPTQAIQQSLAALQFSIHVADTVPQGHDEVLNYTIQAAGRADGTSYLTNIALAPVTIHLLQTGVTDWALYE